MFKLKLTPEEMNGGSRMLVVPKNAAAAADMIIRAGPGLYPALIT